MATAKKTKSSKSVAKPVNESFSANDYRETYEMLRAAHTLLRMAFGSLALLCSPDKKEQADEMCNHFDYVFRCIRVGADKILAESKKEEGTAAVHS